VRRFDRWAQGYEGDPGSRWLAGLQQRALAALQLTGTDRLLHYPGPQAAVREMARVLAGGGRVAIGDGVTDRVLARAVDALNRAFDSEHVRMYRVAELGRFLRWAEFDHVEWKRLVRGGYAIVRATKR